MTLAQSINHSLFNDHGMVIPYGDPDTAIEYCNWAVHSTAEDRSSDANLYRNNSASPHECRAKESSRRQDCGDSCKNHRWAEELHSCFLQGIPKRRRLRWR